MSDREPVIRVQHVSKSFGGVHALQDVHFEIYPGEVHALLGENGAGKSTLIKIITGVHQPDTGEITLEGQPGNTFKAGKLGEYTIDPDGVVLLGKPTVFDKDNIDQFDF